MNNQFNFTIAISPSRITLDKEMEYAKSALLYADTISIISPMAYLYFQLTEDNNQYNERKLLHLIKRVLKLCKIKDPDLCREYEIIIKEFEKMLLIKNYKKVKILDRIEIKKALKEFAININNVLVKEIGINTSQDISFLVKEKKLIIQEFNHSLDDIDGCVEEFFNKLKISISKSYPIFDEKSNDLMCAAIKSGIVNLSQTEKNKISHAKFTENVLTKLPSFEYASVDEIIDIRKELEKPLIKFRSKMLNYTDSIQSLPWDGDFNNECFILYNKEIAPKIIEIEELISENTFIKNLGYKIANDDLIWQNASGLVFGIAAGEVIKSFSDTIASNPSILTAAGGLAISKIASAYSSQREKSKDINRKDLYFYYKAGENLQRNIRK